MAAHRIGTVGEVQTVQSSGVQFCEADLQDAVDVVLKLPENLPAMPTMLGQTDIVQDEDADAQSLLATI